MSINQVLSGADCRQKKPASEAYLEGVKEYLDKKTTCYQHPIFYIAQYLETGAYGDYQNFTDAMTIFGYDIHELRNYRAAGKTGLDIAREIVTR
jgi:hypothetical protein